MMTKSAHLSPFADSYHFPDLLEYLQAKGFIFRWKVIGGFLRIPYSRLKVIERNEFGEEERMMAMLDQWLSTGTATKQALLDALRRIK